MIIEIDGDKLNTSDLQFAYKSGFSTAQCTFNLLETIKYYNYKSTTLYLVLLDASKAFDRVNYSRLFTELLDRMVHPLIIRFLLSSYLCQLLNVKWRQHLSAFFSTSNGVKQGGVLSPLLFSVFVDELLVR